MKVPFVDLKAQYLSIQSEIDAAIKDVVDNTAFIGGKHLSGFEEEFAKFCNASNCVGVANGTDALYIALTALGIGAGDEVIVPANTFVATSEAVSNTGAKVVFVDCDPTTYNITPETINPAISSATKAIIPVHLFGQPTDLPPIVAVCKEHKIRVVQDCAQAHGSTLHGKPLSVYGDVLCFSFYPGKNLGAYGDAGAIVTNDDDIAKKARMYANHGRISKYDHEFEGVNSRLDGIQAAVLRAKLPHLRDWTAVRRRNAELYNNLLDNVAEVTTPGVLEGAAHVYHLYVVRAQKRDELKQFLAGKGIATGIHYPTSLPNLTAYKYLHHAEGDFPVASDNQSTILSLPMYPELSEEMIQFVHSSIVEFYTSSR